MTAKEPNRTIRVGHEQTAREQARRTSPDFVAVPTKKPEPAPRRAKKAPDPRAVTRAIRQMGL